MNKIYEVPVDGAELDDGNEVIVEDNGLSDGGDIIVEDDGLVQDVTVIDNVEIPNHEIEAQALRNAIAPVLNEEEKQARFDKLCVELIQVEAMAWKAKLDIIQEMRKLYDDKILTKKLTDSGIVEKLREAQKLVRMTYLRESKALPDFDKYSKSQIETISSLEPEIVKDNLCMFSPDLSFKEIRDSVSALNPKSKKNKTESNDVGIDLNSLHGKHVWISVNNIETINKYSELLSKSKISDCVAIKRSKSYCDSNTILIDTHEGLTEEMWDNIVTHKGKQYEYTFSGALYTETSYSMGMIFIPKAFFKYLHIETLDTVESTNEDMNEATE